MNADVGALVDTLRTRLGPERVFRLTPVESQILERAVKRIPPPRPQRVFPGRMICRGPHVLSVRPPEGIGVLRDYQRVECSSGERFLAISRPAKAGGR
ncbi:hypothetical protein [Bradyrhizobium genosp. P]|uniref:hypothetical protein n=1 Tax=Bradyrhizobium genosp. P TaxID=83641 RepID=UPI003CE9C2BC